MKYEPFFSWRTAVLESDLPATTRHVLLTLACHMNDAGESCFPSIAKLCRETGLSNRTVITHLNLAKDSGWLRIGKIGFAGQRWAQNDYRISYPTDTEGGEGGSPPFGAKVVNLTTEGSEPNDRKVVKEVHTSTPVNSPIVLQTPIPQSSDPFSTTPPFITLTLNTGVEYPIHEPQIAEWGTLFPAVDTRQELRAIRAWLLANPKRRKTRNGILRFITSWLSRTQDRGGNSHAARQPDSRSRTKRVSDTLDDIARRDAAQRGIPADVG
jgi:hypothetical protein